MLYLFAHLAYMFMNENLGEVFELIRFYVTKISDFITPAVMGALMLVLYTYFGIASAVKMSLICSLSRLIYTIPYYYIIFIYNYSYDSLEAILLSAVASVLSILFTFLISLVSLGIGLLITKRINKLEKGEVQRYLSETITDTVTADFLKGANAALLAFPAISFVHLLISEIIDTVSFFIEYRLDYTGMEILTIIINYVLLFAMVVIGYIVAARVKRGIISKRLEKEEE